MVYKLLAKSNKSAWGLKLGTVRLPLIYITSVVEYTKQIWVEGVMHECVQGLPN